MILISKGSSCSGFSRIRTEADSPSEEGIPFCERRVNSTAGVRSAEEFSFPPPRCPQHALRQKVAHRAPRQQANYAQLSLHKSNRFATVARHARTRALPRVSSGERAHLREGGWGGWAPSRFRAASPHRLRSAVRAQSSHRRRSEFRTTFEHVVPPGAAGANLAAATPGGRRSTGHRGGRCWNLRSLCLLFARLRLHLRLGHCSTLRRATAVASTNAEAGKYSHRNGHRPNHVHLLFPMRNGNRGVTSRSAYGSAASCVCSN